MLEIVLQVEEQVNLGWFPEERWLLSQSPPPVFFAWHLDLVASNNQIQGRTERPNLRFPFKGMLQGLEVFQLINTKH